MGQVVSFQRPAFDDAKHVVLLGIHAASDGSLVLDAADDDLRDDVRMLCRVLMTQGNDGILSTPRREMDRLSDVVRALVQDLEPGDAGQEPDVSSMLAAVFDRFSNFFDARDLAAGSGDPEIDPLHGKRDILDQTEFDFTRRAEP